MNNVSAACTHLDLSQTEPKKVVNVRKEERKKNERKTKIRNHFQVFKSKGTQTHTVQI